jgi:hypothetical protein
MNKPYNILNWYWHVGGDATRAYSSAVGDYVPSSDATFIAWKADGTQPTKIDTEFNLGGVLGQPKLGGIVRPVPAGVLDGYQDRQAVDIVDVAIFRILFNHENRLRALERQTGLGSAPDLTPAQAKNAVKNLM